MAATIDKATSDKLMITTAWKTWLLSAVHAMLLLFVCYYLWNRPDTLSGESGFIRIFNAATKAFSGQDMISDSILLVNVAYDRQLIDYKYDNGEPAGNIDITDRYKLLELFRYLENTSYAYILCDVFFDSTLKTEWDDSLFTLMSQLPRLVVPKHEEEKPLPALLEKKAAYADYKTNILEGDLLKYEYLQHGEESVPLFMWKERTGGTFEKKVPGYKMEGKRATNSVIIDFQVKMPEEYNKEVQKQTYVEKEKNYWNLGADLLETLQYVEPSEIFKNKMILIGDLTEHDTHSTTAGTMPGVLINYNAYLALIKGSPQTPFFLGMTLFVVFYIMSFLVFSQKQVVDLLPLKNDTVKLLVSWLGFSAILILLNTIAYYFWGRFIEIFFWATYFSAAKLIIDLCKLFKRNKK
ncbi:MAG: CHASE2 domain-containing protein [Dysgonamonadaceae bacterium]|jgi:hypothetical protein|nr:CHASE2 domain-containing protein [Dysgonamonadaceae bacterium]